MTALRWLCVFCGSSSGTNPQHRTLAADLGKVLADEGVGLVYGGAHVGLMGAVADAVLDAGGEVLGVIPGGLRDREIAHEGVTELQVVTDMHERKKAMYARADAFCALPGGYGTFEELFEATTWNQLGLHDAGRIKPLSLLARDDFWDPLVTFLDRAVDAGFVKPPNRDLILTASEPSDAVALLKALVATGLGDPR